ncbi:winged helix-turn-helix domain-containing protein [Haloarcula onubensis]|uniref:Helix-turn-helix domain-containing protein n=1 Tax=Haloarcula onubensis TaxID=2950539 RepID=A0ABU2FLH1_9EURY|nr:helix-turn-helix domain-containing protein [Halomicroarcula sp. S3CR25-11]MDS0281605.1 helix-turn-helix domain-containing protein [Halomicroarcula sp. S3CR25-11]
MTIAYTESSSDELFEILSHSVRRRVLTVLVRNEEHEAFSPEEFAPGNGPFDAFLASLHHVHLPKLAEAGFIRWNRERGTVTGGPRYDEVAPLVTLLLTHEDDLPVDWL